MSQQDKERCPNEVPITGHHLVPGPKEAKGPGDPRRASGVRKMSRGSLAKAMSDSLSPFMSPPSHP